MVRSMVKRCSWRCCPSFHGVLQLFVSGIELVVGMVHGLWKETNPEWEGKGVWECLLAEGPLHAETRVLGALMVVALCWCSPGVWRKGTSSHRMVCLPPVPNPLSFCTSRPVVEVWWCACHM